MFCPQAHLFFSPMILFFFFFQCMVLFLSLFLLFTYSFIIPHSVYSFFLLLLYSQFAAFFMVRQPFCPFSTFSSLLLLCRQETIKKMRVKIYWCIHAGLCKIKCNKLVICRNKINQSQLKYQPVQYCNSNIYSKLMSGYSVYSLHMSSF